MVVDWNSFKESIEDTFYNEKVTIYEMSQIEDAFGAVIPNALNPLTTKNCNIQNSNRDITKKEFGIDIDSKYRVSLLNDFNLDERKKYICKLKSDIKNINHETQYGVVSIQPFNTYVLLFLKALQEQYEVNNVTQN